MALKSVKCSCSEMYTCRFCGKGSGAGKELRAAAEGLRRQPNSEQTKSRGSGQHTKMTNCVRGMERGPGKNSREPNVSFLHPPPRLSWSESVAFVSKITPEG